MTFPDLVPDLRARMPELRGRLIANQPLAELTWFRVGGALRMNGGAYGGETKDVLIDARGVDRAGGIVTHTNADMHYTYRHCGAPEDVIFTTALFQGRPGDPPVIAAEMDKITESREA